MGLFNIAAARMSRSTPLTGTRRPKKSTVKSSIPKRRRSASRVSVGGGGGSIGRPHVAATLLEAGHVSSWDEAFDLWIGRDRPAYVERYKLSPEDAIQLLRGSGGLAVLAHPYIYNRYGDRKLGLDLKRWLPRLSEAGLAGIEVYYPNYPRRACRELLALAIQHGLLVSGGSDFHGGMLGNGLGNVAVPWAVWEGLARAYRAKQSRPVPAASPSR